MYVQELDIGKSDKGVALSGCVNHTMVLLLNKSAAVVVIDISKLHLDLLNNGKI